MVKKITALWTTGILLSILLIACCKREYLITGLSGTEAYELIGDSVSYENLDTIRGPFRLNLIPELEYLTAQAVPGISRTLATSCAHEFINSIENVSLFLDKPFIYDHDTIPANQNLIGLVTSTIYQEYDIIDFHLDFDTTFMASSQFSTESYTFEVVATTSDSMVLTVARDLYIDID
ncbi:MAG: hypothetical protein ACI85F_002366 [Bacteroidia bacterium]|jgi:hypothetical protein